MQIHTGMQRVGGLTWTRGWTDRVEGAGQKPDKTGLPGVDKAAAASNGSTDNVDADGEPAPLSRPG